MHSCCFFLFFFFVQLFKCATTELHSIDLPDCQESSVSLLCSIRNTKCMFRLLMGGGYRCLSVQSQLTGWRQNATVLQKTKPNHPTAPLIRGNMTLLVLQRSGVALAASHSCMHINTACANILYALTHMGRETQANTHTHNVQSLLCSWGDREGSVPRLSYMREHEWYGFVPPGLACHSAKLL